MSEEKKKSKTTVEKKEKKPDAGAKRSKKEVSSQGSGLELESGRPKGPSTAPRLKKLYNQQAVPALMKQLGLKNAMQVPRLKKIIVSAALKEALVNPKVLDNAIEEIAVITGQRPRTTRAKKSIAGFKLRAGQAIGCMVTLRKARMFEFFDRLVNMALPRVRDFKGLNPKSFDGRGNYSLGLKEQIIFPEINYDRVDKIRGMNITINTTAKSNEHAKALLLELGMPFRKS